MIIKRKNKKIKNIRKIRGIVKNWKIEFNLEGKNAIRFYYFCNIEFERRKITKENFILVEPNIEISLL